MLLNGVDLVDRHGRPSVGSAVALRALFINNGVLVDPFDVSSCTVFAKLSNASPSSVIDSTDGLLSTDSSSVVLMSFGISGNPNNSAPHDGIDPRVTSKRLGWVSPSATTSGGGTNFSTDGYFQHNNASGIYRVGTGDYVAVLDGSIDLSGVFENRGGRKVVANAASAVLDYIDIWTVKLNAASDYQLFINSFSLDNDTFVVFTEPLIVTTKNNLVTKNIRNGEKVNLAVTTEITVQNRELPEETKNLLKDFSLVRPSVYIQKVNEDSTNQAARENVTNGFITTSVQTTSDNTILYSFDTATFTTPTTGKPGTYIITVKYSYLDQTFVSPPMYFTLS